MALTGLTAKAKAAAKGAAKGALSVTESAVDTARSGAGKVARTVRKPLPAADELHGPSPNPATNLAIADIALRSGTMLARRAVEQAMLGRKYAPKKAKAILKGRSLTETLLHGALARVAMRSVPGALLVGGALVAKTLYDRSKARDAAASGEDKLHEMAKSGENKPSITDFE